MSFLKKQLLTLGICPELTQAVLETTRHPLPPQATQDLLTLYRNLTHPTTNPEKTYEQTLEKCIEFVSKYHPPNTLHPSEDSKD